MSKKLRNVVGSFGVALAAAVVVLVQVSCGGGDSVAASGTDQVGIAISTMTVSVENKAGLPLTNLTVVIEPSGIQKTTYTALVDRIENTDKRDIPLNQFASEDGTPYNSRVRAKAVRVTATDMTGKQYEAVVPWEQ